MPGQEQQRHHQFRLLHSNCPPTARSKVHVAASHPSWGFEKSETSCHDWGQWSGRGPFHSPVRRAGQGGVDRPGPDAQCLRATVRSQEAGTWSGQYLDRSKTRAAVPADLTQHPALPVSLQPLFPLITIYRHDVEYLKFSCLNEIFRFDVVLGKKENIS